MSALRTLTPEHSPLHDARWRRFQLLMLPGWHGSGDSHLSLIHI